MSGNFFSKFDSEYFSLIIFLKYLLILLLMLIFVTKMTLLEKNKLCRTFRAVGHLGTLQPYGLCQGEVDAVKRGPKLNMIKNWGKGRGYTTTVTVSSLVSEF